VDAMAKRIYAAAALVLAGALTSCGPSCKSACDNYQALCSPFYPEGGPGFNRDACQTTCDSNPEGCKNLSEQISCLASAQSCDDARTCPGCL
jgi:hypothetical protein